MADTQQPEIVLSERFPARYAALLTAEAEKRGISANQLAAEFVIEALHRLNDNTVIEVRRSDLHRMLDEAIEIAQVKPA